MSDDQKYWRGMLRKALHVKFRTPSEFDAFCLDNFPNVYKLFSNGMDRIERTTYLLASIDRPMDIIRALKRHDLPLPNAFSAKVSPMKSYLLNTFRSRNFSSIDQSTDREINSICVTNPIKSSHIEFKIGHYENIRQFLDQLSEDLIPIVDRNDYGRKWILAQRMDVGFWPVLLPWEWLSLSTFENLEHILFEYQLQEFGIMPGSRWLVIDTSDYYVFGIAANDRDIFAKMCNSVEYIRHFLHSNIVDKFIVPFGSRFENHTYDFMLLVCVSRAFTNSLGILNGSLDRVVFAESSISSIQSLISRSREF